MFLNVWYSGIRAGLARGSHDGRVRGKVYAPIAKPSYAYAIQGELCHVSVLSVARDAEVLRTGTPCIKSAMESAHRVSVVSW